MKIVTTGGAGTLGREVLAELARRGRVAVSTSRRTKVDVASGAGLSAAVRDADVVVHLAAHPLRYRKIDYGGTRNLIDALAAQRRRPHIIYVSIVGCEQNPFRLYRAKRASEIALEHSGLPVTVLRTTQFHPTVAAIARAATLGSIGLAPSGLRFQPTDPFFLALCIADLAEAPTPAGYRRTRDVAGPEQVTLPEASGIIAGREGQTVVRSLPIPAILGTLKAYSDGSNLPASDALIGGGSFTSWVNQHQLRALPGR